MKKSITLISLAAALFMTSCGNPETTTTAGGDSTISDTTINPDTTATDSTGTSDSTTTSGEDENPGVE